MSENKTAACAARIIDTLDEVDRLPCTHPASVHPDVAGFYYGFTKMVQPLLVVEIGCFIGFSTLHLARALWELGFGHVIAIDAFDWSVDAGKGLQDRAEIMRQYVHKAGLQDTITIVRGYSTQVYEQLRQRLERKIDILFIDGDHSIRGVFADFNCYYDDVREGGYVVLHDICPSMCGCDGPRALIERLKSAQKIPNCLEHVELPTGDGFGVALLRKISPASISVRPTPMDLLARALRALRSRVFKSAPTAPGGCQVRVHVVDKETGKPVANATLTCGKRWDESRTSDANGTILLPHFTSNRYLVDLRADGFESREGFLLDVVPDGRRNSFVVELTRR